MVRLSVGPAALLLCALVAAPLTPPPPSPPFGAAGTAPTTITAEGYVTTELGCMADLEAATLAAGLAAVVGPLLGFDDARVYELGAGRWLWIVQDAFLTYAPDDPRTSLLHQAYVNNVALLQQGTCFALFHRGSPATPTEFEGGDRIDDGVRFFWPLGGEVHDGRLHVFWSEMQNDAPIALGDGLLRHPVQTWLATYDLQTLARLEWRPAEDAGVFPQYGSAVVSDETHTYLFGNSNLLNLTLEGGFLTGPHSATRMFLARVPRGRFDAAPEYRTASGWSPDPGAAVPISERFWAENAMQPRIVDGQWVAVTKVDAFWGDDIVIDVAEHPWGPWTTVRQWTYEPRRGRQLMNSYHPVFVPWRQDDGSLIVLISENALIWDVAIQDASLYRMNAFDVAWPPG